MMTVDVNLLSTLSSMIVFVLLTGGLFPKGSHENEVFHFALSHHQDIPRLVPQVDMVDTASSFAMTYACKFSLYHPNEEYM